MNFIYPYFLAGLSAVAIPIIIHLFNFQRPKKVYFSNVKFLKEVKEATSNRLKLKHLLILLARILFIVFLALTFAQPFIKSKNASSISGAANVAFYLDNSYSMQNELEEGKALDIAVKSVSSATDVFPPNTSYSLFTNDFEVGDQFYKNKEKLVERLSEINFSSSYRGADAVYKRQKQSPEEDKQAHTFFWFSDFQKSTLGNLPSLRFDTADNVYLVPINNKKVKNVFIDSLWLESPVVRPNENNTLHVILKNSGEEEVKGLVARLYIDNAQVSAATVDVPVNASAKADFVFNVTVSGERKCKLSFEDFPVTFDNDYYFIMDISHKINIQNIEEKASYVTDAYASESIFNAVNVNAGALDYSALTSSNVIIINELEEIPASLTEALRQFYAKGGSVVIVPSGKASADSYKKLFSALSLPPVSISAKADTAARIAAQVLSPDFNNPFFKGVFEKNDKRISMPYAFPVLNAGLGGEVLLKTKGNTSFLSVFRNGKGKVYVFSSPFDAPYTDFYKQAIFVPVLYKIAFNSITENQKLSYSLQQSAIEVDVEAVGNEHVYELVGDNFKAIPDQRFMGKTLMLQVPRDEMKAGFFDLKKNGATVKTLAFNYGKSESYMEFYSPEELMTIFGGSKNVHVYKASSSDEFVSKFKKDNIGVPLWKYCLILCLLFLLAELLLIRFFK